MRTASRPPANQTDPPADPASRQEPQTSGRDSWIAFGGIALALALFVLALYGRLLFTNRVLAGGDILFYFYPYRALAAEAVRNASVPLWNPYIFMGAPLLANPQAAALYPLHWPLSWLPVTGQIYWSAVLHTWLLGLGGYCLLRARHFDRGSSLIAGLVLAGSGFYGGLMGHINQMNGAAWLPWTLLTLEWARRTLPAAQTASALSSRQTWIFWTRRVGLPASALLGLFVLLMLLAGHIQTAYINLFGLGVWVVAVAVWEFWPRLTDRLPRWAQRNRQASASAEAAPATVSLARVTALLALLGVGVGAGALAGAAQLLPALELSGLGLRSGGLSYAEASSFSLRPLLLGWTLLPSYGLVDLGVVFSTSGYTEYVAYVGALGLLLALWGAWAGLWGSGVWYSRAQKSRAARLGLFFAGLGLFLALGRWNPVYFLLYYITPGFDLFRAPARWMMLYTLGMALLAGVGSAWLFQRLHVRRPAVAHFGMALLALAVAGDLLLAARALPHTQPTAPQAVYDVRTAPAHLLTDPARTKAGPGAMGRFLSMSALTFDPGDLADYRRIFTHSSPPVLDEAAFAELIVALKAQEILAPNLAMLRQIPGVDGFDGGTLPLGRYNDFLTLLIPPDALVPDGRVREQLQHVPPSSLLSLLNVQYVITDKVQDLWFRDVYYDRQIGAVLPSPNHEAVLEVEVPYPFPATHIGVIGYVEGDYAEGDAATLALDSQPVARISAEASDLPAQRLEIEAGGQPGAHFADPDLDSPLAESAGAVVAYRDVENGRQEYLAYFVLDTPVMPDRLLVESITDTVTTTIQAITLVDERTGMFLPLLPSDRGRFQRAHSGDVKIYEHLDVLPRAYLVNHVQPAPDPESALARLADPAFDPAQTVVIEEWETGMDASLEDLSAVNFPGSTVEIMAYTPEAIELRAETAGTSVLVLSDVYYPGWRAWIDGVETPVYRANYLFRAIVLPPGAHSVSFRFEPESWRRGLWLSSVGLVLLSALGLARLRTSKPPATVRLRSAPDV